MSLKASVKRSGSEIKVSGGGGSINSSSNDKSITTSNPWATTKKRSFNAALQLLVEDDIALENALKYFSSTCPEEGRAMPLISALRLIDDRVIHARQLKSKQRVTKAMQDAHCPDKETMEEINQQLAMIESLIASRKQATRK